MFKMSIILSLLKDELERSKRMLANNQIEFMRFEKGSLFIRTIKNSHYAYRVFRSKDSKIVQTYLGVVDQKQINDLQTIEEKRKKLQSIIKVLKQEVSIIEQSVAAYERKSNR